MMVNDVADSAASEQFALRHPGAAGHSRFVQRIRRRYEQELALLPPGAPRRAQMLQTLAALRARGLDLGSALRVLRHLVLGALAVLDSRCEAPLAIVTLAVTELAEIALDQALIQAQQELDELHGAPLFQDMSVPAAQGAQFRRATLWVVGMGKFGARELNVSSDIDLIYVYDNDGDTAGNAQGRNRNSNREYFAKAVKCI